jgi:hypothetical protein
MIKLKQINNEIVKPIKLQTLDIKKIKGHCVLPDPFCNVFLVAKKRSGKTNAIFKILKSCANKYTSVIIFASTVYKDDNWIEIVKYLNKKKIPVETHISIFDDDINQVEELVESLKIENEPQEEKKEKLKLNIFNVMIQKMRKNIGKRETVRKTLESHPIGKYLISGADFLKSHFGYECQRRKHLGGRRRRRVGRPRKIGIGRRKRVGRPRKPGRPKIGGHKRRYRKRRY